MGAGLFNLESFYAEIGALPKEHAPLRQNLVRGLKDYFRSVYGYDRYGGETIFLLQEHMNVAHTYGFGAIRTLSDRRISGPTKVAAAARALSLIDYGSEKGTPFGLTAILLFLAKHDQLSIELLRIGLIATAGFSRPFEAMGKQEATEFVNYISSHEEIPGPEKLFWLHTLICRHGDQPGASDLINATLGTKSIATEDRIELCRAWLHFRQPRMKIEIPGGSDDPYSRFVADRFAFWLAHMPSWPGGRMVHLALVWLARLTGQAEQLVDDFAQYRGPHAEHIQGAVAEILLEHRMSIQADRLYRLVDQGALTSGSGTTRRKFYRVGTSLFGPDFLRRASTDSSASVRQWAMREQLKQSRDKETANP